MRGGGIKLVAKIKPDSTPYKRVSYLFFLYTNILVSMSINLVCERERESVEYACESKETFELSVAFTAAASLIHSMKCIVELQTLRRLFCLYKSNETFTP